MEEYGKIETEELEIEECPVCDGDGEVVAYEKITCRSVDVPYKVCPACSGSRIKQ